MASDTTQTDTTASHAAASGTRVDVKTPEQVAALIKEVDKRHNLKITANEMKIMMAIAANESNFGANAGVSSGNAKGLYQFIPSTWKDNAAKVVKNHPETAAIMNLGRENDYAQVLAMTQLMRDNAAELKAGGMRDPKYADIYTAHHWGASRALKTDDTRIADTVRKYEMDANPAYAQYTFGEFRERYNNAANKNLPRIMAAIEKSDPQMYAQMDATAFSNETSSLGDRLKTDNEREAWFSQKDVDDTLKKIILEFFKSDKYQEEPAEEKSSGILTTIVAAIGGFVAAAFASKAMESNSADNTPAMPSATTSVASLPSLPLKGKLPVAEADAGANHTASTTPTEISTSSGGLGVANNS